MQREINITLGMKLASAVVHAQEMLSPGGHDVDKSALRTVVFDPEVEAWLATIDPVLLPVKRQVR